MSNEQNQAPERRLGTVTFGPYFRVLSRTQVVTRGVIALVLLIAILGLCTYLRAPVSALAFIAYVVIASLVHPEANHADAMIVDNPLRITDNANRMLAGWAGYLMPGKFIGLSLVDAIRLIRTGKLPQDVTVERISKG